MLAFAQHIAPARAEPRASEFTLANGMQVVVIPDHRAPVVTHMVWYKVGAADEPKGVSGIAHFLEHLMFKSTDKIAVGEFSKIISRLGGQDNAFTGQDVTSYHQRISKERLATLMVMEADRMANLRLTKEEVATERQVILEERRSRIDNNPAALLDEQMNAALYLSHPYGIPVIGWEHEMAMLSREDALRFYKHYYAPNNAILIVAGDVAPEEVKALAEETYGKVPANPEVGARKRPQEPAHIATRRLVLKDARAGNASLHRYYVAPSYTTAKPGEAESLELLMKIVADGSTSRLYKKLVVEDKIAATSGGDSRYASGSHPCSGNSGAFTANAADFTPIEPSIARAIAIRCSATRYFSTRFERICFARSKTRKNSTIRASRFSFRRRWPRCAIFTVFFTRRSCDRVGLYWDRTTLRRHLRRLAGPRVEPLQGLSVDLREPRVVQVREELPRDLEGLLDRAVLLAPLPNELLLEPVRELEEPPVPLPERLLPHDRDEAADVLPLRVRRVQLV